MENALALLAQPRRMEILHLLWHGERTAGDLAASMPVTFGAVSQHLRRLREAGLVGMRKEGKQHWYSVRREALGPLAAALEAMWGDSLARLKHLAEEEEKLDARRRSRRRK